MDMPSFEKCIPLINAGLIQAAREHAASSNKKIIIALEELYQGATTEFTAAIGLAFSIPIISAKELHMSQAAFDLLPHVEAINRECILIRAPNGTLKLVFSDPFDQALRAWAENYIDAGFQWTLAHVIDIRAFLANQEESWRALESLQETPLVLKSETASTIEEISLRNINEHASAVVKLVHSTLYDALKVGASDIHLETGAKGLNVKYRIDGVLTEASNVGGEEFAEQVISRIKVMAELDIAEQRVPQDGRFKVSMSGREIDFRVSIMPSIYGEDAVLRILDKRALADQVTGLNLDQLGFDAETVATLRRMSNEPYGMVLVTGPTGSGKTTTLYAALTEINRGQDKIVTIEDPVEYQLTGVLQIPVNEKKGLTFARGLRSILRHDPDRIMVGEIRDEDTAQIAVQAALTGHLVFTTVHANSVLDVISRFLHMGVIPHSFVSALNGIIAQRLIRVICNDCSTNYVPNDDLLHESGISAKNISEFSFRIGRGCAHCRGSGYKGRKAVAEILRLNDEIRAAIISQAPTGQLKELAKRNGTRFLRETALGLVKRGETTLEEINRVTFVE